MAFESVRNADDGRFGNGVMGSDGLLDSTYRC